MVHARHAVGIDLGSRSIRAVEMGLGGTTASVERAVVFERSDLSPVAGGESDEPAVARELADRMASRGLNRRGVWLAIGGQDSILRYTRMPPMASRRLETVMQYEVESAADRMGEPLASDFAILPLRRADGEQTILLGLARHHPLQLRLEALEAAGIGVASAVPAPLALFGAWDFFAHKEPPDSPDDDLVLAIDIGARNLCVALVLNNRLIFTRSASFGGENFTEALAGALAIDRERAEEIKLARGGLDEMLLGVERHSVQPLRGAAGQLVGMLQSSVRFASSQVGIELPSLSRLWLTGAGARLRGLPEYLGNALGRKRVELFDPAGEGPGERTSPAAREGGSLTGAIGLGALALGPPSLDGRGVLLDVLPASYKKRRDFREKTIWLFVAAGLLVALLAAQLVQGLVVRSGARDLERRLKGALAELEARRDERDASRQESARTRERIERIRREADVTSFQAFVLDYLGRSLRAEIQLEQVDLVAEELDDDTGYEYRLLIEGRANDERRKGLDWIVELQEKLAAQSRIDEVRILDSRSEGPWYTFRLTLRPSGAGGEGVEASGGRG